MKIAKRNKNDLVDFDKNKIVQAIIKAMSECERGVNQDLAWDIAEEIENEFEDNDVIPTVESVSDRVEELLAENGRFDVSRKYILFRDERTRLREQGWEMTDLQKDIYEQKYRFEGESFDEFLDRVSGGNKPIKKLIANKKFLPAGRILAGRGLNEKGKKVCYSNCFVITPPEDNLESIFDTAKKMARTYSFGGGCGTSLENLRPRGSMVNNAAQNTTGSVSFAELYSTTTGLIGQNSRRGALMLTLPVTHPDILEFINIKRDLNKVTKANISVMITDDFMKAVKSDSDWTMRYIVKDTGEVIEKTVRARDIMKAIASSSHAMAEPGALLWDKVQNWHINSENPDFKYTSTNPCFTGDMKLLTYNGYENFEDLDGKEVSIVNINGEITNGKVWCSGEKETINLILSNNEEISCTPNHVFMDINENEHEAKDLKNIKIMPYTGNHKLFDDEYVKYGFIQGDGCLGRLVSEDHKGLEVNIGEKDNDILFLFRNDEFTKSDRYIYLQGNYKNKLIELGFDDSKLPERSFPSSYDDWTNLQKSSFLQGCYSANGSVITNYRVSYKTTSKEFAKKLAETLADDFDINAYITTNKVKEVEFNNGTYLCKESYDINIGRYKDIQKFHNEINFYHLYKKIALRSLLKHKAPYVRSIRKNGIKKVYDFNEPKTHWGVVEGYIAHNCGEKPLTNGGSCLLGSLNLDQYVKYPFSDNCKFDLCAFEQDTRDVTVYMNEVLDEGIQYLPLDEQKESVKKHRQLGIGIMGMADMFIKMKIIYGSEESKQLISKILSVMANASLQESSLLAKKYGTYEVYNKESVLKSPYLNFVATKETLNMIKEYGLRNAELLSIAPTGSLSTMLGVSGGCEPIFANSFSRKSESLGVDGQSVYYKVYTSIVKEYMSKYNIVNEEDLPNYFVTAMDLNYRKRIELQGVLQLYIDSAISSTVNLSEETTIEEIEDLYIYAWEKGLKGITIYRDNCERTGILNTDKNKPSNRLDKIDELKEQLDKLALEEFEEHSNLCPLCGSENLMHSNGCVTCVDCGYSPCSI